MFVTCGIAIAALLFLGTRSIAQITAAPALINFQGVLKTPAGAPLPDGTYSITVSLWDSATAGAQKWSQTLPTVAVNHGVFAVVLSTATPDLFNGSNLWLEIKIGSDAAMTPRQQIVSVPFALKANTVPDGSIGTAQLTDGAVTATKLATGAQGWLLGGNTGTNPTNNFLGTTDNQPLTLKADGHQVMVYSYATGTGIHSVNVQGGSEINTIGPSVIGGTIAGGGEATGSGTDYPNAVLGNFGAVGGGRGNSANGIASVAGGGFNNAAIGNYGAVGGGELNNANGHHATVPGGASNTAGGAWSFAAGQQAVANNNGAFVWNDGSGGAFASSAANQFLIHAAGGVGINTSTPGLALDDAGGVSFDGANLNNGALDGTALHFGGAGTGEGLASKRTAGGNQYGLDFYTNYNNRMAIDTNGNIGMGISSPGIRLDDIGGISVDGAHANTGALDGSALHFGGAGSGEGIASNRNGSNPYTLDFYTNNTNRLSINNNGNIGIGTTNPQHTLDVIGNVSVLSASGLSVTGYSLGGNASVGVYGEADNRGSSGVYGTSNDGNGVYGYSGSSAGVFGTSAIAPGVAGFSQSAGDGGIVGAGVMGEDDVAGGKGVAGYSVKGYALYAGGAAGGTTNWSNVSDVRYKTNVATMAGALDMVLALRGVTFDWRRSQYPDKNFPEGRQVGFIAQEIEKVLPEVVTTDADGYKSVAYGSVVPVLVESVKALKAEKDQELAAKDAEIRALRQQNASMDARLRRLEKIIGGSGTKH